MSSDDSDLGGGGVGDTPAPGSADDKPEAGERPSVAEPPDTFVGLLPEPDLPPPASVPRPMPNPSVRVLPTPVVEELVPAEGAALCETRVVVRGRHLHREFIVRFGGVIAMPVGAIEPRELTVLAPARDKVGSVEVTVQNPGTPVLTLPQAFRYFALPAPQVTAVAPHRGAVKGGTELSVSGKNFVAQSVVLLDGARAKTRFIDAATLEAVTPAGKAGSMVDVAVENPDGKRAVVPRAFVYDERYR